MMLQSLGEVLRALFVPNSIQIPALMEHSHFPLKELNVADIIIFYIHMYFSIYLIMAVNIKLCWKLRSGIETRVIVIT